MIEAIDEDLQAEYPIWLVVGKGWAKLHELETEWSLDDLLRAVALIECEDAVQIELTRKKGSNGST